MSFLERSKTLAKTTVSFALAASGILQFIQARRKPGVTILTYHKINDHNDPLSLAISPEFFDAQLKYLASRYRILSLPDAISRLEKGGLDQETIVITFDDGWRDNITFAFPLLKKYGIPATIFFVCDSIESGTFGWHRFDHSILTSTREVLDLSTFGFGRFSLRNSAEKNEVIAVLHRELKKVEDSRRLAVIDWVTSEFGYEECDRVMLSWEELREMAASGLINFGAHTLSHPILTRIPAERAMAEIGDSKKIIEQKLGLAAEFFAYPNGGRSDFNVEIERMVAESGYRAACSALPGRNTDLAERYALRRMDISYGVCRGVGGGFSGRMFALRVSGALNGIVFRS